LDGVLRPEPSSITKRSQNAELENGAWPFGLALRNLHKADVEKAKGEQNTAHRQVPKGRQRIAPSFAKSPKVRISRPNDYSH
jgi:hypothetical protein